MNCHRHLESGAVAVCVNCGRAVCPQCIVQTSGTVVACSKACGDQSTRVRETLEMVARKTLRSTLITAWFCWLSGGIFVVVGLWGAISDNPFSGIFPILLGAIFIFAGDRYRRVSRRDG